MSSPRYPDVSVTMIGNRGNDNALILEVVHHLRKNGASEQELEEFNAYASAATSWRDLIGRAQDWVAFEHV